MNKMRWSICLVIIFMSTPVLGDFYRYVDKSGNVKFTDDLKHVPVEQLPKVKTYIESKGERLRTQQGIPVEKTDVSAAEKVGTTSDSTTELDQIKARLDPKKMETYTSENEGALARKLLRALQMLLADSLTARENLGTELVNLRKALDDQRTAAARLETALEALASELASTRKQISSFQKALKTYPKTSRKPSRPEAETGRVLVESPDEPTGKAAETEKVILAPLPTGKPLVPDGSSRQTTNLEDIDAFVHSWARAWEGQDVNAYLAHYSSIFRPTGGISLTMWIKQRQKRVRKPAFIAIGIRTIKKQMTDGSHARVKFNQTYQSDTYTDQVVKTLDLQWKKNRWAIVRETSRSR